MAPKARLTEAVSCSIVPCFILYLSVKEFLKMSINTDALDWESIASNLFNGTIFCVDTVRMGKCWLHSHYIVR